MDTGRVIIAAPSEYDSGFAAQTLPHQIDEVAEAIRSFYQPVPLIGRVTAEKLFGELRKGAKGFWFIGHGTAEGSGGLMLSDGIVSPRSLGRYLATAGIEWSYFNTCDSGALVEAIQAAHPHDVFANITEEIEDAEATQNGILMARGIADFGRLVKAYRWVVSGGPSKLRIFPSPDGQGVIAEREQMAADREQRAVAYVPIDEKLREHIVRVEIKAAALETDLKNNKEDIVELKALMFDFIRELRTDMAVLKTETKPLAQAGLLAQAQQSSSGGGARWVQIIAISLVMILFALVILLMILAVGGGLFRG